MTLQRWLVYEYNTEDDTTKMVLQGLRLPMYISVDHTPQGTRYILTLVATLFANGSVKIYNESWQLLTTIKQGINKPWDTAPCPGGFLLADHDSNKITFYNYKGVLVRTVLTEEDGLYGPVSMSLKQNGYLLVTELLQSNPNFQYKGQIKCFKILK